MAADAEIAIPTSAPSTQQRILSLKKKRALAKRLARKSKQQPLHRSRRHGGGARASSLYVLLYDELLTYGNFSSLRANASDAALALQHATNFFPPSRANERVKAVGAAASASEALAGLVVWDGAMDATQMASLGTSLTTAAAKGGKAGAKAVWSNSGVQMVSVRGALNRSETEQQAQQWADRGLAFAGGCAGLRHLDLSHGDPCREKCVGG